VVSVNWLLRNDDTVPLACRFASEWNLALLAGQTYLDADVNPGTTTPLPLRADVHDGVERFALQVPLYAARLAWQFAEPCELWVHEIQTVSQAEGGFELNYQGHMIMAHWEVHLAPGQEKRLGLVFRLTHPPAGSAED
jgi:hypothetical protein